jgi:ParB family chromosome partitioning protein
MRFELPTMEEIRGVVAPPAAGVPLFLPVEDIDEDPDQPRKEFDEEALRGLAATIAAVGVRQPVSVRPHPKDPGRWILNFGARRLRASKMAGKGTIPAFEDRAAGSYDQVIENEQREGLKPLEIALFIQRQLDRGQSRADIARGIGKSPQYITHACALVDAPDWLMDLYRCSKCRGLLELYALRRLHAKNAGVVEAYAAGVAHVGRTALAHLKMRLAESEDGPPARGPDALADSVALVSKHRAASAADSPSGALHRMKSTGEGRARRTSCASQVVVRARHGGATVRVLLDDVPAEPDSVFVHGEDGVRTVARIDALVGLELGLARSLRP